MSQANNNRRDFLKTTVASATGVTASSLLPKRARAEGGRIRFAAVGLNHGHITGQTRAMLRGGAELVSFYAKEPELAESYGKQFPQAKQARSEAEILEDLIVAAAGDAKGKLDATLQAKMQEMAGGLPLPPGLKLF